jgi:hypothetical protein
MAQVARDDAPLIRGNCNDASMITIAGEEGPIAAMLNVYFMSV